MPLNRKEKDMILRKLQSGDTKTLKDAIKTHANLNLNELLYEQTGDSALHIVARLGSCTDLQFLLQTFSPDYINYRNKDDKTPLHEAVQFTKQDNVRFLIENGADVNALKRADWTPLMLASTKTNAGSFKIAELLIEHGAIINHQNKDGWTALHFACKEGNVDIVNLLLENGADAQKKTKNGRLPLHVASLHGHKAVVSELLKQKIDVNSSDSCGNTPFLEAVLGGSVETCKILLQLGADAYVANSLGFSALHLSASTENSCEMIEFLVNDLRLEVNAVSKIGLTPLHCAARANNKLGYDLLLSLGANRFVKDSLHRLSSDYFIT